MELILKRTYKPNGTNGIIYTSTPKKEICNTIELPWLNNQPQKSCIPEGRYQVKMRYSLKYKMHIQVLDVFRRSLILIHPANNARSELKGCIAPVSKHTGEGKGLLSRIAFEKLKLIVSNALVKEPVYLIIKS